MAVEEVIWMSPCDKCDSEQPHCEYPYCSIDWEYYKEKIEVNLNKDTGVLNISMIVPIFITIREE
jgi:hypothetical protein